MKRRDFFKRLGGVLGFVVAAPIVAVAAEPSEKETYDVLRDLLELDSSRYDFDLYVYQWRPQGDCEMRIIEAFKRGRGLAPQPVNYVHPPLEGRQR